MSEPAELLLIKDQYERAFDCLNRGLGADEAGRRIEAQEYYKKGRLHLTQGLDVPTGAERQQGAHWDTARQLQQKMRAIQRDVTTHLIDMETAELTTESQRGRVLLDLPPRHLYPSLGATVQPPNSSLHRLYPSVPDDTVQTTVPSLPPRPPDTHSLPSGAQGTMAPSLPVLSPQLLLGVPGDQPPAYTPQPTEDRRSLANGPARGGFGEHTGATAGRNGEELLLLPSGAQMFFVTPDGQVSSLSHSGYLRIIRFDCPHKDSSSGRPTTFVHVCDWLYPLTTDTPVLLANSGIFMFPDTMAETPGSYVGIVLSFELPAADRDIFKDILSQLTDLRIQAPEEGAGSEVINLSEKVLLGPPSEVPELTIVTGEEEKPPLPEWSKKMAQGILAGATWLSKEFVRGAEATGKGIHKGGSKIRDNITPEDTPSEVSPGVTKGLQVTKQATGGVLRVSQFLVNGVCMVAGCVGEKLGPHVKKHGAKLIPESLKKGKDGRPSNLDGAKVVAASSVQGFSTVWAALETGAKYVGKSVASETVTTVKYKYGDDAGEATGTAIQSVVNVGVAAYNIDHLGMKAILKTTGKQTAKAMIKDRPVENGPPTETGGKNNAEGKNNKDKEEKEKQKYKY